MATNLELQPDELDVVREVLTSAISDLSPEIADTDNYEYREALKARRAAGPQAERPLIRRREARLEDARERGAARTFDANRGERVIRSVALVGAIEYLPVAQLTASAEADAAGADSAEGKCNLREVRAGEHAGIGDACSRRVAGGRCRAGWMRCRT